MGFTGPQGAAGARGTNGSPGPQGPIGPPGPPPNLKYGDVYYLGGIQVVPVLTPVQFNAARNMNGTSWNPLDPSKLHVVEAGQYQIIFTKGATRSFDS
jgi:hypothetical protein